MRNLVLVVAMNVLLAGCNGGGGGGGTAENPFFTEWETPFGAPPFDVIETAHFEPAVLEGMRQQIEEIDLIAGNPEAPTFANTITKRQLHMEWDMSVDEAITVEAEAQAICMQSKDFVRAYEAFVNREKPVFVGE